MTGVVVSGLALVVVWVWSRWMGRRERQIPPLPPWRPDGERMRG